LAGPCFCPLALSDYHRGFVCDVRTSRMSTSDDISIDRLEKEIAALNEKADLLEKDIGNAEEKELKQQLRKEQCLLRAQLVELCKEKTILQGKSTLQRHTRQVLCMSCGWYGIGHGAMRDMWGCEQCTKVGVLTRCRNLVLHMYW
ncbi:FlxA-like family protein, partial [Neoaquamicrobium sediminum]|uniref:FlxA-like family protein n=1 Tax=Neoaquamicrobium sediminum TaxID=1849104 RepID=UPI0040372498